MDRHFQQAILAAELCVGELFVVRGCSYPKCGFAFPAEPPLQVPTERKLPIPILLMPKESSPRREIQAFWTDCAPKSRSKPWQVFRSLLHNVHTILPLGTGGCILLLRLLAGSVGPSFKQRSIDCICGRQSFLVKAQHSCALYSPGL